MAVVKMVNYFKYTDALEKMCDDYCKWPMECQTQEQLDIHCEDCPMNTLFCEDGKDKG